MTGLTVIQRPVLPFFNRTVLLGCACPRDSYTSGKTCVQLLLMEREQKWCLFLLGLLFHSLLEKAMAPHSSTLAWKIPWTEEPGRLQSVGSRRVGHDWVTSLSLFTFMHWRRKWHPTPVLLPGESQGRQGLVGCSLFISGSKRFLGCRRGFGYKMTGVWPWITGWKAIPLAPHWSCFEPTLEQGNHFHDVESLLWVV